MTVANEIIASPFLAKEFLQWGRGARLTLRITHASHGSQILTVHGITRNALIAEKFSSNTLGVIAQRTIGIDDFPIHLSVNDEDNGFSHGECWVSVELLINDTESMHLCSGFVYAGKGISWPAASQDDQKPSHGFITSIFSTNPAAGSEPSIEIGAGQQWRFIQAKATLVTDATAANRVVHLLINGGNAPRINAISSVNHTASLTRNYSFANYGALPAASDDDDILVNTPSEAWIEGEGTIAIETTNIQAADDWQQLFVLVEKFVGNG